MMNDMIYAYGTHVSLATRPMRVEILYYKLGILRGDTETILELNGDLSSAQAREPVFIHGPILDPQPLSIGDVVEMDASGKWTIHRAPAPVPAAAAA